MPQPVTVILNGPIDWDEWLEVVKTKSVGGRIWDFVNPNTNKSQLPTPEKPMTLPAKDAHPLKTALPQLTDGEKDELKLLRYDYKHQLTLYERQDAVLASLR
jgi:phospholipase C